MHEELERQFHEPELLEAEKRIEYMKEELKDDPETLAAVLLWERIGQAEGAWIFRRDLEPGLALLRDKEALDEIEDTLADNPEHSLADFMSAVKQERRRRAIRKVKSRGTKEPLV